MPDSEVLVDKIVKLQRLMAKKQEKVDFMEEHIGTLLEEVKKKNKIIQHYVMKAETGALVTTESDRNKVGACARRRSQALLLSDHTRILPILQFCTSCIYSLQ